MFSSVTALRAELRARLEAAVPDNWRVLDYLTAPTEQLVPAAYIEFHTLTTRVAGSLLPAGQVSASVDIVIVDPRTADELAEAGTEEHLTRVLAAFDRHPDIMWTSATKFRMDTGELAWRVNTTAVSALTATDTEEEE